ncbi:MAG: pentapeptide repeat-containing protein, partial [Clostridium perfringens]|nr:pentapeptide repeat-containing protein [Clostridium perfringens]
MKVWEIEFPKIPLELNKVDDVAEEILKEEK